MENLDSLLTPIVLTIMMLSNVALAYTGHKRTLTIIRLEKLLRESEEKLEAALRKIA